MIGSWQNHPAGKSSIIDAPPSVFTKTECSVLGFTYFHRIYSNSISWLNEVILEYIHVSYIAKRESRWKSENVFGKLIGFGRLDLNYTQLTHHSVPKPTNRIFM